MSICYDATNNLFHLQANDTSYMIQVLKGGYLAHLYWGKRIRSAEPLHYLKLVERASFCPNPDPRFKALSLDTLPQEYPAYGNSDFRSPAYQIQLENGSTITNLLYNKHTIYKGKPKLDGLPATYTETVDEADTLELEMMDSVCGLKVTLIYTAFEKYDAITRSVRFENRGNNSLKLLCALSMSLDFKDSDFDMLHLYGAWARERNVERTQLITGMQSIESRRGSSSHQHNPFIALLRKDSNEDYGDVFGFSLVYSGSFVAQVEVDQFSTTRINMGMNPFDFCWTMEAGQSFQTPEVVMVYSSQGLGEMSRTYHKLYRTRLCRGVFREKERPILINNWEATYFNFNAEKIMDIAKVGKDLGIELFVLDDGWFGKRNSDNCSLGDWFVNSEKLPDGLESLVKSVNNLGLQFGLWFEPEMVSPDSDLYRNHPDWCLHVPDRNRTLARDQMILDFSRRDVCEAITKMLTDILSSSPVNYVKWDMNRNMTEIGSALLSPDRQRETAHRYILGLYGVLEKITSSFPHILFESCSGGGGRFDPGMLYYMPQTWTSDNSDAVERLKIQYGTSIVYPISTMGAHVSAVPNHQVNRKTPLNLRGNVAMSGNLGYELDLTKLPEEEKDAIKKQVAFYKENRKLVQFGDFYRLFSPFDGNETAWMFVSENKTEVLVTYTKVLEEPNKPLKWLKLRGLNPSMNYILMDTGEVYGGDELMYSGLSLPDTHGDFSSFLWKFKAVS